MHTLSETTALFWKPLRSVMLHKYNIFIQTNLNISRTNQGDGILEKSCPIFLNDLHVLMKSLGEILSDIPTIRPERQPGLQASFNDRYLA